MSDEATGGGRDNLDVSCPCCRTKLVIDRDSGEVLFEERPQGSARTWEEALVAGEKKKAEAEALFSKGMARERNADAILEKKFREALERADKSDTPPKRIFDLD